MNEYQLKAAIKNQKPPVWRRIIVPGGITYSQLSLILTEVMEAEEEEDFLFEFYQRKIRFREGREDRPLKSTFYYSIAEASEFYIDELLDTEDWFSFYYGEGLKLRVTIEKALVKDGNDNGWPVIIKAAAGIRKLEDTEQDRQDFREKLLQINREMKKKYQVLYGEPERRTRSQIQKEHREGRLGLRGGSSLSKERLAEKVANGLLMTDVMQQYFLKLDDKTIEAWEAAVDAGPFYRVSKEQEALLAPLYDDNYLAMYDDGYVQVPREVAEKYKKINTPQFLERRKRVSWMQACLFVHGMIYGIAPADVVMRMYRKKSGYRLKQSEFMQVFRDIPEDENPCVVLEGKVIRKPLLRDKTYEQVEEMQEPWDFFVPEADEIEDCSRNGYPSGERHYKELKQYLIGQARMEEKEAETCLKKIWMWTTQGYDAEEIASSLKKRVLGSVGKQKWKEFTGLIGEAQAYTRLLKYRGFMAAQVERTRLL